MKKREIQAALAAHGKWLIGESGGKRANLSGSDLSGANLSGANLARANLTGANLSGANLSGANLTDTNLADANLLRADLSHADLTGANLDHANLRGANLVGATNAPLVASVSWTDHGECGRILTAMRHPSTGAVVYWCACFSGSADDLRRYIADGPEDLRESRTEALEIVSGLMDRMVARREHSA